MFSICFNRCIRLSKKLKATHKQYLNFNFFFDQYDWKEIDFPSNSKNWNQFEQNNKTIAFSNLFVPYNTKEIRLAYKSKYNHKPKNQVILLMIIDGEKWHYLAVKRLSALLKGIASNHKEDFYCLNCFHSYSTVKNRKKHDKYVMIMIIAM